MLHSYLFAAAAERKLEGTRFRFIPDSDLKELGKCMEAIGKELGDASLLLLLILDSPPSGIPDSTIQAIQKSFLTLSNAQSQLRSSYKQVCEGFFDAQLFETTDKQS